MACSVDEPICLPPVKRGDTWTQVFTWMQGKLPLDITGSHAALQLRRKRVSTPLDRGAVGRSLCLGGDLVKIIMLAFLLTACTTPSVRDT